MSSVRDEQHPIALKAEGTLGYLSTSPVSLDSERES